MTHQNGCQGDFAQRTLEPQISQDYEIRKQYGTLSTPVPSSELPQLNRIIEAFNRAKRGKLYKHITPLKMPIESFNGVI